MSQDPRICFAPDTGLRLTWQDGEGLALTFLNGARDGQRATLAANSPGKIIP